jgi:hypothetical protein
MVRNQVEAAGGKGPDVNLFPNTAILSAEYGVHANAYPEDISRDLFFNVIENLYGYDGTRARPPADVSAHQLPAVSSWSRSFTLNSLAEIRPEHPAWRTRFGQIRRLFPLRIELYLVDTDSAVLCTLSQDEVDCIRQEYALHMLWETDYFQTYSTRPSWWRKYRMFSAGGPHIIDAGGPPNDRPALGAGAVITVPKRRRVTPHIRPPQGAGTRYGYSFVLANWRALQTEVANAGETYAERIRTLMLPSSSGDRDAIRAAMADTLDYPDPVLPAWAAEVVVRVYDLTEPGASFAAGSIDEFLRSCLTLASARARFAELDPFQVRNSSSWRSPEYNEAFSSTPLSNHQRGVAFDVQPLGAWRPGLRNPLAMLCLHLAALSMEARLRELLMENNAHEYFVGRLDAGTRDHLIIRNIVGSDFVYVRRMPDGTEADLFDSASLAGDEITTRTELDRRLARTFSEEYSLFTQTSGSWPSPPPTYRDLYIFALTLASHVHFTWRV